MTIDSILLSVAPPAPSLERSCRLVVITEIISPYRIPVFNALARMKEIDLQVVFLAETDPTQRQWLVYKDEIRFSYEVLPSWRRRIGRHHALLNRGLARCLQRFSPDVLVCGGYNYAASWQALWWARQRHVPFLAWVESTGADRRNRHRLIEFLKLQFMKNCQGFVVAGKSSAEYVRSFGAADATIFPAPDAVDTAFFAETAAKVRENPEAWRRSLDLPPRFFLFAGRLVEEKGAFDLLRAYQSMPEELRNAGGLVFAGDGPARTELERRAGAISAGEVKFIGFVQREQLAACYALAETFVFPTYSDPWGLVVNEAMACGLPVICGNAAGCAADLVEDGWNGCIVRSGDVGELGSAMEQLARDAGLRTRMGQHSRERIQMYSPQACAAGIAKAAYANGVRQHA